jgi:hypothetical protein
LSGAIRPGDSLYTASRADSNTPGLFSKKDFTPLGFHPEMPIRVAGGALDPWIASGSSPYCSPRCSSPLR